MKASIHHSSLALTFILMLLAASSLQAAIVVYQEGEIDPFAGLTYTGTDDNLIVSHPTQPGVVERNYGGHSEVFVGKDGDIPRRGLYRFDVTSLDGLYDNIQSATLRLHIKDKAVSFPNYMDLYRLTADNASWVEGTAGGSPQAGSSCWAYRSYDATNPVAWDSGTPGTGAADYMPGGPIASVAYDGTTSGTMEFVINDPAVIADWVAGNNPGLLLRARDESNDSRLMFHSSESGSAAFRPELRIEYTPPYVPAVLADSPEAYWQLNETTGNNTAVDSTGNGHDFTYETNRISRTGAGGDVGPQPPAFRGMGADNNAPTLTNTGATPFEPLGTATGVWSANDYSIEMWFRNDQLTSGGWGGGYVYLFHRSDADALEGTGDLLGLHNFGSTGVNLFAFDGTGGIAAQGTTPILGGEWYHLIFARQDDNISVFLNGELEMSGTMAKESGYKWSDGTFTFGYRIDHDTINQKFGGGLDEIAVYGRALDAETAHRHWLVARVPEPSSMALLFMGMIAALCGGRRRRSA